MRNNESRKCLPMRWATERAGSKPARPSCAAFGADPAPRMRNFDRVCFHAVARSGPAKTSRRSDTFRHLPLSAAVSPRWSSNWTVFDWTANQLGAFQRATPRFHPSRMRHLHEQARRPDEGPADRRGIRNSSVEPGSTSSCDRTAFRRETSTNANPILLICMCFLPQFGPTVNRGPSARKCPSWEYYPQLLEEIGLSTSELFVSPMHFVSGFGGFGSANNGPTASRGPSPRRMRAEPCDVLRCRRGREPTRRPSPSA